MSVLLSALLRRFNESALVQVELHNRGITIKTIRAKPVPLMNKAHSGCRPVIEILTGTQKMFSNATADYERLK